MNVPQSVRICAYLCGSVLFDLSLSVSVYWLTCAILHRFAEHILHATSFVCEHNGGSVCYLCVVLFGEALSVLYLISISRLNESGVRRLQGFRIIQNYVVL